MDFLNIINIQYNIQYSILNIKYSIFKSIIIDFWSLKVDIKIYKAFNEIFILIFRY